MFDLRLMAGLTMHPAHRSCTASQANQPQADGFRSALRAREQTRRMSDGGSRKTDTRETLVVYPSRRQFDAAPL